MLNDVHGLDLTPDMVERLHDRTEGWAAGLYLAVLSMRWRGMRAASSRPSLVAIGGWSTISRLRCSVTSVRPSWASCLGRACSFATPGQRG
jgi:hypothetical protein